MSQTGKDSSAVSDETNLGGQGLDARLHGVRYQVKDVSRAAAFYTTHLGFKLEHQHLPAFATVALGDFKLLLSGPGASGSRAMPDGQHQEPGGWNRVVLQVAGNPIELFEPAR
jgi:glyoxylase I family protein